VNKINNVEIYKKAFQNFLDLFVTPEVQKRQEAGKLPKPLDFRAAQIIFYPDGRRPEIRINSEVLALAKMKLKEGVIKEIGEAVYENELDGFEKITLTNNDDPNCGHVTMLKINNEWFLAFDAIYDKQLSKQHLETAKQFIAATEFAFSQKHWSTFVDNLFSAAELIAKAILLGSWSGPKFRKDSSHRAVHSRFNKYTHLGNADPKFTEALNKLSKLRYPARYVEGELNLSKDEAQKYLDVVKKMYEDMIAFYKKFEFPSDATS